MTSLLPYIVVGITSGSIYAIAGLGLSLTFKTSGIVNFAHGAQAALAAFVVFELRQRMGLPWPVAVLVALLAAGVAAGLVLERLGLALATAPTAARVAATVGVLVAVQGALTAIFGTALLQLRFFLPTRLVHLPGVNVRVEQLITTGLALAAAIWLSFFFGRTRTGVALRAVVDDPDLAALEGTPPARARRVAWIIGSCFAALSGILIAPTSGLDPTTLTELVLFAFGAAAVGAFTSLPLTYAGGIGIGVGAALITKYLNTTGPLGALPSALPVIVLLGALVALPKARPAFGSGDAKPAPWQPAVLRRAVVAPAALGVGLALLVVPFVVGSKVDDYTTALGFAVMFGSLALLVRGSGQISLCHMAFAAVGATTFARALGAGWPWPVALVAAGLVAVPIGVLVALPAIRLSGVYLAVGTLAFGMLMQELVFGSFLMFGGAGTVLRAPRPAGFATARAYYFVVLAIGAACFGAIAAVRRTRLGRLLRALADEPAALDSLGTDTRRARLLAFGVSAGLAAIAGALIASVTGSVTSTSFDFSASLLLVALLYVGGPWAIGGPLIAAALYVLAPIYVTNTTAQSWLPVAFGVAAVLGATAAGARLLVRVGQSKRTAERTARRPARVVGVAS
jgi:branched-subunit amino acid ABC-type transport system permease component